ncbi:MAG TPA: hypothetical protein VG777_03895, partial [Thermoanaerobaculia bacterium]|nr:hypothetical protein [Thermoanaerobaculia bacterium]
LRAGKPADAQAFFREDLRRNPKNPWSLAGLAASLAAQHRDSDAKTAEGDLRQAAGGVDVAVFRPRR